MSRMTGSSGSRALGEPPLFRLAPLAVDHCIDICSWRYEPPYDTYNWAPWNTMVAAGDEFADPAIREAQYAAVLMDAAAPPGTRDRAAGTGLAGETTPAVTLAGFAQFFPLVGVTRLGLGMHPAYRGRGWGEAFVSAIVCEALCRTPEHEIDLEVLVWNDRARRIYERVGFVVTDRYVRGTPTGPGEFYCMVLDPGAFAASPQA